MSLSQILAHSCMIIHYIVEEFIFVVTVYKLLARKEILKCHINDCFKINGKQRIKMPRKGEYVRFKNYERKIKSLFVIYDHYYPLLIVWPKKASTAVM